MGDLKDSNAGGDAQVNEVTGQVQAVDIEDGQESNDMLTEEEAVARMAAIMSHPMYNLPKSVRRTVGALKNLQKQHIEKEVDFFKELHALEVKYEQEFQPIYERRSAIISGDIIPTEEECKFEPQSEDEIELSNEIEKVKVAEEETAGKTEPEEDIKGIPDFWLTAFKHAPTIADMIEEYDEPILKHLVNVKSTSVVEPMSFKLDFYFSPNEYFTNSVLTKFYELKCAPDPSEPFSFEGPEIVATKGCKIDWNKNKNVTVKTVKKKQKHKARGSVRTITKTVENDSFFNFFSPPDVPENPDLMDDDDQATLNNDYEVGNLIKDRIIPHAILFFTGENLIDDDFDEEDDEDYEDDEDEEMDEEDDEDDDKAVNRKKSKAVPQGGNQLPAPECKQQ